MLIGCVPLFFLAGQDQDGQLHSEFYIFDVEARAWLDVSDVQKGADVPARYLHSATVVDLGSGPKLVAMGGFAKQRNCECGFHALDARASVDLISIFSLSRSHTRRGRAASPLPIHFEVVRASPHPAALQPFVDFDRSRWTFNVVGSERTRRTR